MVVVCQLKSIILYNLALAAPHSITAVQIKCCYNHTFYETLFCVSGVETISSIRTYQSRLCKSSIKTEKTRNEPTAPASMGKISFTTLLKS